LYKRIISRLDIKNGKLVKGISLEGVRNLGDPDFFSKIYYDNLIDEMHFHNVIASLYESNMVFEIIERNTKKIFVNVSVGGGVRSEEEVDKLLRIGVDKVVINSAAVKDPVFLKKLVEIYGASTISVNIETAKVNGKYKVFIETGRVNTGIDLYDWIEKVQKLNVGEIIITDIFAEGKNNGFNTNLFKEVRKNVDTQLVAHGGAGPKENILEIFTECNVDAISIASLFHYHYLKSNKSSELKGSNYFIHFLNDDEKRGMSILELKKYLKSEGVKVRL
tara:strand:+ start:769 stop:1599 length:831 start_codon:yes stop_codon:yes gene_type:complete